MIIGKPREFTALSRKALTYQKRQWFTNICCIALCPLFMVGIASFLGNLIVNLIQRANPIKEYMYCSNYSAMNEVNIPYYNRQDYRYPNISSKGYPLATFEELVHTNWAFITGQLSLDGPPGAEASRFVRPCVYWYGSDYPTSDVYERSPLTTSAALLDSAFLSEPLGGWAQVISLNNITLLDAYSLNVFLGSQLKGSTLLGVAPSVTASLVGSKVKEPEFSAALLASDFVPSSSQPTTGLLGKIPTRYFGKIGFNPTTFAPSLLALQPQPWYNQSTQPITPNDLDDLFSASLQDVILKIAAIDKSDLSSRNFTRTNLIFAKVNELLKDLPEGMMYINEIDHAKLSYSFNFQYGSDIRVSSASNFPFPGQRQLFQQTRISNAILKESDPIRFGNATITQGLRILPYLASSKFQLEFAGLIGGILFPFGVSFLLPVFVVFLVQEKESRILIMMKMNGVKEWTYYLSQYITMLVLSMLSSFFFIIMGVGTRMTLFTATQSSAIWFLFFIWANNQISLAFFFSTLFNRSRTALVIVFLLVLCSVIISLAVDTIFVTQDMPLILAFWPPFAFYRILLRANRASFDPTKLPLKFSNLFSNGEYSNCMAIMIAMIFFFFLFSFYLEAILPSEFGIKRPWYFPFQFIRSFFAKPAGRSITPVTVEVNESEIQFEDQDVRDERKRVLSPDFKDEAYPLVMRNMRKVYAGRGGQGPKLAVRDVSLAVEEGITFGLLGPNGAGKSTLISILTGLYEASGGKATLAGFDIKTQSRQVYQNIGICPQFDILWDELSVEEHMYFYARLKGVSPKDEEEAVQKALDQVSLLPLKTRLTKGLSGGEKRRVSIAIALLGKPKVVFLDEPTTGLDPEVRRLIWNIVNDARKDKTIILTTHSMEEAEALCQRIGIMAKGTLRCLAEQTRLKELYGNGFKIYANSEPSDTPAVAKFIESVLPNGWKLIDAFATNISYEFPAEKGALAKLFKAIEENKAEIRILDWGIGQTTLEEVFVKLISEADASAEY